MAQLTYHDGYAQGHEGHSGAFVQAAHDLAAHALGPQHSLLPITSATEVMGMPDGISTVPAAAITDVVVDALDNALARLINDIRVRAAEGAPLITTRGEADLLLRCRARVPPDVAPVRLHANKMQYPSDLYFVRPRGANEVAYTTLTEGFVQMTEGSGQGASLKDERDSRVDVFRSPWNELEGIMRKSGTVNTQDREKAEADGKLSIGVYQRVALPKHELWDALGTTQSLGGGGFEPKSTPGDTSTALSLASAQGADEQQAGWPARKAPRLSKGFHFKLLQPEWKLICVSRTIDGPGGHTSVPADAKFKRVDAEKLLAEKVIAGGVDIGQALAQLQCEVNGLKQANEALKRKVALLETPHA